MRLREKFYLASLLWVAVLTLLVPAAWAAETDLDGKAAALDRGATTREAKSAIFSKFHIPTTDSAGNPTVYAGMPPGQALVLFSLCGTNAACQTQALANRQAHMGWGKVAENLKARNLSTNDKVGQAVRQVTNAHRDLAAKAEKPERPEKPGKAERPERPERPGRPGR